MARVKNAGGGLANPKAKATKKIATKKRKYLDVVTARAAVVAEATEHAERGGAHSGVVIADQQLPPATIEALEQVERHHGGPAAATGNRSYL